MLENDDVNRAFGLEGNALVEDNDRLFEYLRVLCHEQYQGDANRLLANNRAITINAILMRHYLEREYHRATVLTWWIVGLAALNVLGIGVQIWIAVR